MSIGGGHKIGEHRMGAFLASLAAKGVETGNLTACTENPIEFAPQQGGRSAYGYEATILADLCDVILDARNKGLLVHPGQRRIAARCEILMRGFARIGIIALVDAATGYEEVRDRLALQALLDKYLRKELAAWAKRFPDEFYKQIFRLRDWEWKGMRINRPSVVGHFTNDVVYERLAPGVLEELKRRTPKDETGRRPAKLHQWFTEDVGHPALAQHLHAVVGLMKASANWGQFHRFLERAFPKRGETMTMPLDEADDK